MFAVGGCERNESTLTVGNARGRKYLNLSIMKIFQILSHCCLLYSHYYYYFSFSFYRNQRFLRRKMELWNPHCYSIISVPPPHPFNDHNQNRSTKSLSTRVTRPHVRTLRQHVLGEIVLGLESEVKHFKRVRSSTQIPFFFTTHLSLPLHYYFLFFNHQYVSQSFPGCRHSRQVSLVHPCLGFERANKFRLFSSLFFWWSF